MSIMMIEIPGAPRGKGRPRFTRQGHTYTDAATREYEARVAACGREVMAGRAPLNEALSVQIIAFFAPPLTASKARRADMLSGAIRPTGKADADNIAKAILDGLNGVVFADDRLVCELLIEKHYAIKPSVAVIVTVGLSFEDCGA